MENPDDNMSLRVASFAYYLDTAKENYKNKTTSNKPPLNTNFSLAKDSFMDLRVDSFSYLNNGGENFAFKVPGPVRDPTASFSFSQEIPRDSEISVFGADKYFNMKLEHQTGVKPDYQTKGSKNLLRSGSNIRPKTPSLCSEESSWNSQTALFPNIPRTGSQTKQKKAFGRRILAGIGCQLGPCFERKDVYINEIVAERAHFGSKPTQTGSERNDPLQFIPTPNLVTEYSTVKKQLQYLEESRISIDVFGSGTSLKGDIAANMERKLSMLTWDAIPKGQNLPASTVGNSTICDDMASDASSDLFEIENISGSMYPLLTAEATDDQMSSCMSPVSQYAPSEASIQWSVVTASAADFSSVLSCYDKKSVSIAGHDVISKNNATNKNSKMRSGDQGKEVQKSRPGGLLRCKSYKAVNVAENSCVQRRNQDFHLESRENFYKEFHV